MQLFLWLHSLFLRLHSDSYDYRQALRILFLVQKNHLITNVGFMHAIFAVINAENAKVLFCRLEEKILSLAMEFVQENKTRRINKFRDVYTEKIINKIDKQINK